MLTLDCGRCLRPDGACDGCFVTALGTPFVQVEADVCEPCGLVPDPEVAAAIDVLLAVGLIGEVDIVEQFSVA